MTTPQPPTHETRVAVVSGPVLAAGFRLAGLPVHDVMSAADAGNVIEHLAARGDTGIVLVQQDLFDALPEARRRAIERAAVPVVVPIPIASWDTEASGAEAYILDLLQRAIGYRVRLQ